jgi:TP901 family phage tail tape measure protein
MAQDLKLMVTLAALDQATKPLRAIAQQAKGTADALQQSQRQLRELNAASKRIDAFQEKARELRQLSEQTRESRRAIERLQNQISRRGPEPALLRQIREQQRALGRLNAARSRSRADLARQSTALQAAGINTSRLGDEQRRLANEIQRVTHAASQQQAALTRLNERQRTLNRAARDYRNGMQAAANLRGTGLGMLGTGTAAGFAAGRTMGAGIDFEAQVAALRAVGRFGPAEQDPRLAGLIAQARSLGASTAFSAGEVGAGQEFLLRAGMQADAVRASMADVLALAQANRVQLDRAADIASGIGGAFRVDMSQAGAMQRVADVLTGVSARAKVDVEMLGETMKYLGAGSGLGLTLEQAAALSGLLGNVSIQGSEAGTTLRAMMTRLAAPTDKAAGIMAELGLQTADAAGNLRPVPAILDDLAVALGSKGNVEAARIVTALFDAEAGSGVTELLRQAQGGEIGKLISALQGAAGENQRAAGIMSDTTLGDIAGLKSAWQDFGITLQTIVGPALRALLQRATEITRGIGEWARQNPALARGLALAAGAVVALTVAGGALLAVFGSLIGPLLMLRYTFAVLRLGPLLAAVKGLAIVAIPALITALKMLGAAVLAHPIVAFIALVAAAAGYIWANWETLGPRFAALWNTIKSAAAAAWQAIKDTALAALQGLASALTGIGAAMMDGLVSGIRNRAAAVYETLRGIASKVKNTFTGMLGIHSPSRVFMEYGRNLLAGLRLGMRRALPGPLAELQALGARLSAGGRSITGPVAELREIGARLSAEGRRIAAAGTLGVALAAPAAAADGSVYNITINVHGDTAANPRAIAVELRRALDERERAAAARERGRLYDID